MRRRPTARTQSVLAATADNSRHVRNPVTRHRPLGPTSDQPALSSADPAGPAAEAQMRRALGLDGRSLSPRPTPRPSPPRAADAAGAPGRHRHRFVSDGEVPVVVVNSRQDPAALPRPEAAAALDTEREARRRAERALTAAQASIRELQSKLAQAETKLAHVSLARDEAVAALRRAQDEASAAPAAAPASESEQSPPAVRRRGRPPKPRAEKPAAAPRERGQKPVKWWVKGWRSALAD